jgi:hypothetical protein
MALECSIRDIAAQPNYRRDEKQDDECGEHKPQNDGPLATASHIFRPKGCHGHDQAAHPKTGANDGMPATLSIKTSAKTPNSQAIE